MGGDTGVKGRKSNAVFLEWVMLLGSSGLQRRVERMEEDQ